MILLLGGTSETQVIAEAIAATGESVLVSRCTDTPLETGTHDLISVRTGPLDSQGIAGIIREENVQCVVDATHPYAINATQNAVAACRQLGVPCLRFERPGLPSAPAGIRLATGHGDAAEIACSLGRTILITTGTRNLEPYVRESARLGCSLYVRALPCEDSLAACRALGVPESHIIARRGPFSTKENIELIRKLQVEVLVTKDSGAAGGLPEKLEAANGCGCKVVMVSRPRCIPTTPVYGSVSALAAAVQLLDKSEVHL